MRTGRRAPARVLSIAAAACIVATSPGARAADEAGERPGTRVAVPAIERLAVAEGGFGAAWSAAVESAFATVKGLSIVQRFVAQRIAPTAPAPLVAAPAAAQEKPRLLRVGPVTFGPVTLDRTALMATEPRPFEAVVLGASVPLPWTVP